MRLTLIIGVLYALLLFSCTQEQPVKPIEPENTTASADSAKASEPTLDAFGFNISDMEVKDHTIKRNESLYVMLDQLDFSPQEIFSISKEAKKVVDLHSMRPGQQYRTYSESDTSALCSRLVWQKNAMEYVVFDWQRDSLEIYKAVKPLFTKTKMTSGKIDNSLYQTISHEGGSPLLAQKMAKVFAWQVDFFSLRSGDRFQTLYEEKYVDDEFYGTGDILAAKLKHRGKMFNAYYFSKGNLDGYYTEEGKSVQKALLKAPFKYNHRISSPFSKSRMHPTLNRRRPHNGVDYAAPYGTPILSTGNGVVLRAGYVGSAGNMVEVKHNGTYETRYMHMKGFADGVHAGARVDQGQIIGYVGTTGRSTGPHLHYEVLRNNSAINPLTMDLPSAKSVPDSLMDDFKKVRDKFEKKFKQQREEKEKEKKEKEKTVV